MAYEPLERRAAGMAAPLPAQLRVGLEAMSGADLSGVRVHHGSERPAAVGALAYTQGSNIYLGRGQEHHLAHEGWHVVQQMQGRVSPTTAVNGVAVNDHAGLESEADAMGSRASSGGLGHTLQRLTDDESEEKLPGK
jgi:hypothetical protein